MNVFSTLLAALIAAASLISADDKRPPSDTASAPARKDSPYYCNRLALTPEERHRHFDELGPKLRSLRKSVRELSNGYEFEFPSDEAIYQLRLEAEGGPLWLRLTVRPEAKEFMKFDGAAWIAH